ncbi:MAG: hypothetical protein HY394_02375 [Candidatus Diapherotrites archaeon]|nr:hypothetical protein [Candidatus Diapherotrites archaeon]
MARFLERETVSGIYSDEERAALCEGFPTVGRLLAAVRAGLLVKLTEQAIVELAYAHRVQLPKPFTGRPLKTHVILEYLAPKYPSREAMIADIERVVQEIPGYQFVAELERVEGEKR